MESRIAIFLPSLEGGGAEKCMVTLAEGFAKRNLDVTFVLPKAEGPHLARASEIANVVDLRAGTAFRSIPSLGRYLRTEKPDVLVSALEHTNTAALIAKRISRADTRVIVTTHTMVSFWKRSQRDLKSRALFRIIPLVYPFADAIVAVSSAVASDLSQILGLPERSVRVIYNPIPIDEIVRLSTARVESPWFEPGEPPVVLAVGSLWPHKDYKTLVAAFAVAHKEKPMRLVILGEGPERLRLEGEVRRMGLEDEVLLQGFVDNPYSWMAKSSVFVMPSKLEGLPTALVEAMACGVTPIATDCPGGSAEVLEEGRCGYLTPVGDPKAMAERILESIDRPVDPIRLRRRAEAFSVERSVTEYLDLMNQRTS
jgi:glycosyltransferase involved in cell wall biosynthesis